MSKFEIDFSSLEAYQKKLEELGRKGTRIETKALEESADIILDEMVDRCPERSHEAIKHLKKDKIRKIKGIRTIKIGVNKADNDEAYYLKFYEYGTTAHTYTAGGYFKGATIKHPGQIARPFMRPAFEKKKKEALNKTMEIIREELKL